jgi:hypothetical protein
MAVNVNRARRGLTPQQMDALPVGTPVIDADMDISVRRADGLWEGYEMGPIPTAKLLKYGPIKRWYGPVPAGTPTVSAVPQ